MQSQGSTGTVSSSHLTPVARTKRVKPMDFGRYRMLYANSSPGSRSRRIALEEMLKLGDYSQWLVVCVYAECGSELEKVALQRITELDPERRCAA